MILGIVNFCISRHIIAFWVFGGSFFSVFIAAFRDLALGWFAFRELDSFLFLYGCISAFSVVDLGYLNRVARR